MITISVCMIVKNEENNLDKCLSSLRGIADEIILVDTGSIDSTKERAAVYTDKIYDFEWNGSFSDARNFAFSKATKDYIYSADADEELDEKNRKAFLLLKEAMLPEIDIVQMYYCNQLENNTIYNYDRELRPKLYKRVRNFVWQEKIHEAVRLEPIIFDSDIEIIHRPGKGHGARDLEAFRKLTGNNEILNDRLNDIYCKELYIAGSDEDFVKAEEYIQLLCDKEGIGQQVLTEALAVGVRIGRILKNEEMLLKYALRAAAGNLMCSETCCELAAYFVEKGNSREGAMWYFNALNEAESYLNKEYGDDIPRRALTGLGVVFDE